jgi:hypothetical protein
MKMANAQNLKRLSSSEARENGKKGGIASGQKRREKANFKKLIEIALNEDYKGGMSNAEAMVVSLIAKALEGDTKAFEVLRDTAGQKPVQVVEDKISGGLQIVWGDGKE